jgi:hypothetical protein
VGIASNSIQSGMREASCVLMDPEDEPLISFHAASRFSRGDLGESRARISTAGCSTTSLGLLGIRRYITDVGELFRKIMERTLPRSVDYRIS